MDKTPIAKRRRLLVGLAASLALMTVHSPAADISRAESPNALYGVAERIRGFDPALAGDVASALAISRIYEGLLQYSYLDRPYRVEPCLCESMPEISGWSMHCR